MKATRSGFSSRLGFVAAAAGSAVGLGNIWKFPYETAQNGGGAFLFVYLICIFLIGFPIMVGEIAMGRNTQANPFGAYLKLGGKSWGWVGLLGVLCGVMILSFYNVVAGWAFGYFLQISFSDLLTKPDHAAYFGAYVSNVSDNLIFSLAFMVVTGFVVLRGIQQGIESTSKVLMPMLFLILVGLIVYSLTLPGAYDGVLYYLSPDFSKLDVSVLNSAMGQAFFSLSLGMGALITYGSYISKTDNITTSAGIVTLADTAVAFLSGLLMLPLVFSAGLSADASGPGLVFTILPGVFEAMGPITGKVIGGTFFLLLCVAALTSTISLLEVPVAYLVDNKKWPRRRAVIVMASVIFLVGLPSMFSFGAVESLSNLSYGGETGKSFLDLVADTFSEVGLPLGGMLLSIFIGYRWKTSNLSAEIGSGNPRYEGSFLAKGINLMIMYICPLVLALIFLSNLLQKFFGIALF